MEDYNKRPTKIGEKGTKTNKERSLKALVAGGLYWNSIQFIINRSFSFFIKLLLAKVLFPEQFGLVGMAVVFIKLIEVFNELGISAALVHKRNDELKEEHFNTAFWTGIAWSLAIFLISLGLAPYIARFYNESLLKSIIPILTISILASPIIAIHNSILTKEMNFKKIALINNSANILSGILALSFAFSGAGIWALIVNSVANSIILIPLYFKATKWLPRVQWTKKACQFILGFGLYNTGTNVMNYFIANVDYLVIGKLLGTSSLGIYTFAFILTDTFRGQIMAMVNRVMFPVYSVIKDDLKRIQKYYLNILKANFVIITPVMIGLFIFSKDIIPIFFGAKWNEAIPIIEVLSISAVFQLMTNSYGSLFRGLGKPKLEFKIQSIKGLFIYVPFIFIGGYWYGMHGIAYAILLNKIVGLFIDQYYLRREAKISYQLIYSTIKDQIYLYLVIITSFHYMGFINVWLRVALFCAIVLCHNYIFNISILHSFLKKNVDDNK